MAFVPICGPVVADTVYSDGALVARDTSITLPEVTPMTADLQAMGTMSMPIWQLVENMETAITKIGADKGLRNLIKPDMKPLEFRWVQTVTDANGNTKNVGCKAFIKGIPNSTLESARIDGANELRCLFSIVLPSCLPIAALISVNTFLGVWNDYSSSLIYLSNSEEKWTLALGFYKASLNPLFRENKQMAMGVLMCSPPLVVFGFSQKLLIEGVSISGMKA